MSISIVLHSYFTFLYENKLIEIHKRVFRLWTVYYFRRMGFSDQQRTVYNYYAQRGMSTITKYFNSKIVSNGWRWFKTWGYFARLWMASETRPFFCTKTATKQIAKMETVAQIGWTWLSVKRRWDFVLVSIDIWISLNFPI